MNRRIVYGVPRRVLTRSASADSGCVSALSADVQIPHSPPLALAKACSRSGCGRIFPLFSRVMREGLNTGSGARTSGHVLSEPIFSGPDDRADWCIACITLKSRYFLALRRDFRSHRFSPSLATTRQGQKRAQSRLPFIKPAKAIHGSWQSPAEVCRQAVAGMNSRRRPNGCFGEGFSNACMTSLRGPRFWLASDHPSLSRSLRQPMDHRKAMLDPVNAVHHFAKWVQ